MTKKKRVITEIPIKSLRVLKKHGVEIPTSELKIVYQRDLCSFCCKPLKTFRVTKSFYSSRYGTFKLDFCTDRCVKAYEEKIEVKDRRPSNRDLERRAIMRV